MLADRKLLQGAFFSKHSHSAENISNKLNINLFDIL